MIMQFAVFTASHNIDTRAFTMTTQDNRGAPLKQNKATFTIILVTTLSLLLYACSKGKQMKPNRTHNHYLAQLDSTPDTHQAEPEEAFAAIFSDYKANATEENIRATYAEELYFNDTFVIIDNIDDLVKYMTHSASQVNETTVDILEVIQGKQDYYIRWTMKMDLTIKGKDILSRSIGMSQLRFDEAGKVIFHQDFWDSSEAFYEQLPYLGYFIRKVKGMME